jgi:tripartite-type tricarboxylate transporter receptor subunit TctC
MIHIRTLGTLAAAGLVLGLTGTGAHADAISDFYSGKRMTMLIGLSTGGAYDRYARVTARHLSRFIPGNPTIIPRNMTGGGSLVMTNFLYNVAPRTAPKSAPPTAPFRPNPW